ncbi:hypothetical protein BaRGS_00018849 [Batillaria attramentaria]|uniref:Uncharacterized protein n=1 Tax=Batillaria attramentaria TaxID=370345 RepID=A0ABD0KRC1_9CAEN
MYTRTLEKKKWHGVCNFTGASQIGTELGECKSRWSGINSSLTLSGQRHAYLTARRHDMENEARAGTVPVTVLSVTPFCVPSDQLVPQLLSLCGDCKQPLRQLQLTWSCHSLCATSEPLKTKKQSTQVKEWFTQMGQ